MAAPPRLLIHPIKDVTIVNFQDASILDTAQIEQIGQTLYELVDKRDKKKLVLDFAKVQFLSSSALGVLLTLRKKSTANKGKIVICSIKADLRKVFKITSLDKLFEFYNTEEEALASFGLTTAG